jgi:glycerate kinase
MRVVVAPDAFKGTISSRDAGAAFAAGWGQVRPGDTITCLPRADGGEDTIDAMASAVPGSPLVAERVDATAGRSTRPGCCCPTARRSSRPRPRSGCR